MTITKLKYIASNVQCCKNCRNKFNEFEIWKCNVNNETLQLNEMQVPLRQNDCLDLGVVEFMNLHKEEENADLPY